MSETASPREPNLPEVVANLITSGPTALTSHEETLRRNLRELARFLETEGFAALDDEQLARLLDALGTCSSTA